MQSLTQTITEHLDQCLLQDRYRFARKLRQLKSEQSRERAERQLAELLRRVEQSVQRAQQRQAALPSIAFPEQLPVVQKRREIAAAIRDHQVVVVAGETGSGKTTQIPKICLELGRGVYGMIGHTQPRRLAARTVASRIAEELNVAPGQQVGYQVRFTDQVSDTSLIKLMTDGILLAETQRDPFLNRYDTLVIDEAHERSLNIDFLLGYIKRLLPKRPDLKVIITSATIDVARFSEHFDAAPVIEVSGRTFPVELLYQPPLEQEQGDSLSDTIIQAVDAIRARPRRREANDILVFLPGEREIRDVAHALKGRDYRHTEILPLYARLSNAEQNRVFQGHTGQRIVLATNVAETSITVPGIGYVIDPGLARISRYSPRAKVQRLPIEPVSQASANQRMGRCGRVAEGLCIRLYDEADFNNRPEFTDAEILRTNLGSVILQMLNLRLGDIDRFPFIDPPDKRAIRDGFELLRELGAVNKNHQLTQLGRQLARFPVDPRIGRMVLAAAREGSLAEVLVIAAALTIQDPRERPLDKQQAADEKHRAYRDDSSDFISLLNLWNSAEQQRQELSQNQFRRYCRENFLSYLRIREWRDIHRQLLLVCKELGFKLNAEPAEYPAIHRALLAGLLSHIGEKQANNEYKGARNRTFHLFPGSGLFKKAPKWLMAAELVETSKLYARMAANIDVDWLEPLAPHLIKRSHFEPHWEKKRGQVMAFEQITLYGLVIVAKRKVDFGRVDPKQAREIFIRSGLVEGEIRTSAPFYQKNRQLLQQVTALEDKSRRRDILVDEQLIFDFYDERLPPQIYSRQLLENWLKTTSTADQELLTLTRDYLMQHAASEITGAQFPDSLQCGDVSLALRYAFQPGTEEDGVTVRVPLGLLNQLSASQLEWLVPGMLRDKCIALVKGLPKVLRKQFVPVPEFVDRALREMEPGEQPLLQSLGHALKRISGVAVPEQSWEPEKLEDFYKMRLLVIDESGKTIGQGRDILALRRQFKQQVSDSLQRPDQPEFERSGITQWDFGRLAQEVTIRQAGMHLKAYSAITDDGDSVRLELADTPERSQQRSRAGVLRLLMLATSQQVKYLSKNLPGLNQIALYYATLGSREQLLDTLIKATYLRVFLADNALPGDQQEFECLLNTHKNQIVATAGETAKQVLEILTLHHAVMKRINGSVPPAWIFIYADIKRQLKYLVYNGFIADTPWHQLRQYPRYLQAVQQRLDKIQNQLSRERQWCAELEQLWQRYQQLQQEAVKHDGDQRSLKRLRWLIEEYRVSLYAQQLGTAEPVSLKRIEKYIESL